MKGNSIEIGILIEMVDIRQLIVLTIETFKNIYNRESQTIYKFKLIKERTLIALANL